MSSAQWVARTPSLIIPDRFYGNEGSREIQILKHNQVLFYQHTMRQRLDISYVIHPIVLDPITSNRLVGFFLVISIQQRCPLIIDFQPTTIVIPSLINLPAKKKAEIPKNLLLYEIDI